VAAALLSTTSISVSSSVASGSLPHSLAMGVSKKALRLLLLLGLVPRMSRSLKRLSAHSLSVRLLSRFLPPAGLSRKEREDESITSALTVSRQPAGSTGSASAAGRAGSRSRPKASPPAEKSPKSPITSSMSDCMRDGEAEAVLLPDDEE